MADRKQLLPVLEMQISLHFLSQTRFLEVSSWEAARGNYTDATEQPGGSHAPLSRV